MSTQSSVLAVVAASTIVAGAAYAANQTASPPAESAAQMAADRDVGKLSADGAAAFRDLHMARLAIFNADPAAAKTSIAKAQSELDKAKTDDTIFNKAEADLKQPAVAGKPAAPTTGTNNADMSKPIAWLPIDGQLALGDDFVATPEKAAAVGEANKSLNGGDQKGALEKLKLADVNVSFTMAIVPLATTTSDVDKAATFINDGKYYEANALLKQAEDGVRFDMIDLNGVPKTQQGQQASSDAKSAPNAMKATK